MYWAPIHHHDYADWPDGDVALTCADSPAAGAGISSMKRDHAFDLQNTRSHIGGHDVVLGAGFSVQLLGRESALRCTCGHHLNNARKRRGRGMQDRCCQPVQGGRITEWYKGRLEITHSRVTN